MWFRIIPNTDISVSVICLGTWQFDGTEGAADNTWGYMPEETCAEIIEAALDVGINFFDAAEAYGQNNQAELVLGRALAAVPGRREKVVIASKFGKHSGEE